MMKKITLLLSIYSLLISQNLVFADTTTTSGTYTTTTTNSSSADDTIAAQKTACQSNTAKQWDSSTNRCVTKADTNSYRKNSIDCNSYDDVEQRKACQLSLASSKTGVTSDASSAMSNISDASSKSALVNGANTMLTIINLVAGGSGKPNTCTSKTILGATAIAGTLTDILMKIKMKKKVAEIEKKYQLTLKENSYAAQYKALEYLKEEQQMVKDIADLETKRQTLLGIGYAAAFATAAYEQFVNTACHETKEEAKKEETKKEEPKKEEEKKEEVKQEEKKEEVKQEAKKEEVKEDPKKDVKVESQSTPAKTPEAAASTSSETKLKEVKVGDKVYYQVTDANGNATGNVAVVKYDSSSKQYYYETYKASASKSYIAVGSPIGSRTVLPSASSSSWTSTTTYWRPQK